MNEYRLIITYWSKPRFVGIIPGEVLPEVMESLRERIDAGEVMAFAVEGI